MQHRFAYAILVRLTKVTAQNGNEVDALYGTVQTVDAPEASHFTSLRQLSRWIEDVLPPHISPQVLPIVSEPPR